MRWSHRICSTKSWFLSNLRDLRPILYPLEVSFLKLAQIFENPVRAGLHRLEILATPHPGEHSDRLQPGGLASKDVGFRTVTDAGCRLSRHPEPGKCLVEDARRWFPDRDGLASARDFEHPDERSGPWNEPFFGRQTRVTVRGEEQRARLDSEACFLEPSVGRLAIHSHDDCLRVPVVRDQCEARTGQRTADAGFPDDQDAAARQLLRKVGGSGFGRGHDVCRRHVDAHAAQPVRDIGRWRRRVVREEEKRDAVPASGAGPARARRAGRSCRDRSPRPCRR